jgi:hypothetical protein
VENDSQGKNLHYGRNLSGILFDCNVVQNFIQQTNNHQSILDEILVLKTKKTLRVSFVTLTYVSVICPKITAETDSSNWPQVDMYPHLIPHGEASAAASTEPAKVSKFPSFTENGLV